MSAIDTQTSKQRHTESKDAYRLASTTVAANTSSRLPEHIKRTIPGRGDAL